MNVVDLFDSLGVEYITEGSHHCTTGWLQLPWCPSCSTAGDRNYRLGVHTVSKAWNCWSCGRLRGADAMSTITGLGVDECARLLGQCEQWLTVSAPRKKGKVVIPDGVVDMLPAHREYLRSRKISPDYAAEVWGVRGIGPQRRLPWRLWLPVRLDRVLSWTTRTIGERGPRYVSASQEEEAIPHKELLYGEELAGNSVIVVEGPLDAMRIGEGAVASFGTSWTTAQAKRLSRFSKRVIVFDSEPTAQRKACELADYIGASEGQTLVVEIEAPDPGSADESELQALRRML